MGCCLSTKHDDSGHEMRHRSPAGSNHRLRPNKAPPPSMEVETVKEVLSETPKQQPVVKPLLISKLEEDSKIQKEFGKIDKKLPPPVNNAVEISEVSEICSVTESVSTTTMTESRDDNSGEVCQRINRSPAKFQPNYQSFSGDLGGRRDLTVGMSPTRKLNQSPVRGNGGGGGRSVRRGVLRNEPVRRDPVEITGRRSRSPGTRSNVGRSPVRKTNRSPSLVKTATVEEKSRSPPATNESLENPLVSLECFIFL